ncbi:MAG: winged helix-turn-helix transcriptional regulator [Candidatus Marinimicrobia bacterium]|jgi:DNA-binding transcriptional ArsR family regulator|nr:winged helix-turn-helix transcriptional regulator [Candidatus Neomarinimicrobiota bacterium]MBT3618262.1 winged helix-turn-helix transcriptional regulator [Candidatus Neomarinimicrobiota bacterium]MBT3829588.1 winged helix-turn-helix transcriptional regulator [Candidatus Neomarinimicrobiota bacterium]MBT3997471.1 winged helix-turn-helix transcriptional regulator [Candidatus Neomarinimicrobiota bacterium]MBT4281661.1 winged helix-turn-helix transcriptional regulator [Candidatus Neomarinimicro
MSLAKTETFNPSDNELADIAKALSHPARITILRILNELNTCITREIVDRIPLSQSTVSQHLKELKRVKLIKGEIEGPRTCYCLNEDVVKKTKNAYIKLFSTFNCC